MFKLELKERIKGQKTDLNNIAGIIYGNNMDINIPFFVNKVDFEKAFQELGKTSIFGVNIGGKDISVMVKDVQYNPVSDYIQHLDFLSVNIDEKIEVEVPLVFVGEAPITKSGMGVINQVLNSINVNSLPDKIPHEIEIDISNLKELNDQIILNDIKLPEGVEISSDDLDSVIVSVSTAKEQEEEVDEESEEKLKEVLSEDTDDAPEEEKK